MKKVHGLVYFESYCNVCRAKLLKKIHDYGHMTLEDLDEKIGNTDLVLEPIKCEKCGNSWPPKFLILADGGVDTIVARLEIGSEILPVVGDDEQAQVYGNIRSYEAQQELERGLAKMEDHFYAHEEIFWDKYTQWAIEDWRKIVKDLNPEEIRAAYDTLQIPQPPLNSSSVGLKKDALRTFSEPKEMRDFWRAANRHIIHDWFLWLPPDQWPVQDLIKKFGLERVRYLIFNFPLPDELEKYRTDLMPQVIKKTNKETGILFTRIGQLGQEVDRHRRRAQQLANKVDELKRENSVLNTKLSEANKKVRELQDKLGQTTPTTRDPEDQNRILRLKGLVKELRSEVKRLFNLIPSADAKHDTENTQTHPEERESLTTPEQPEQTAATATIATIRNRPIAVFGKTSPGVELPYNLLWHHGDQVDKELERCLGNADIYVVLTRLVSHEVMWRVKEEAADTGKPATYIRETGVQRILEAAAKAFAQKIEHHKENNICGNS